MVMEVQMSWYGMDRDTSSSDEMKFPTIKTSYLQYHYVFSSNI
jgi:hypothetical protein